MKIFEHYKTPDDLYYLVLSYIDRHRPDFRDSPYRPPTVPRPKKVMELELEEYKALAKEATEYYMSKIEESNDDELGETD